MTEDQVQFVQMMREAALEAGANPWQADWFTAVACLESGWGKSHPHGSFNFIGYHYLEGHRDWEYVESREGMTGNSQKYRKFESLEHSARCWLYLVRKSSLRGYVKSRRFGDRTPCRRCRTILRFSWQYCQADKRHGKKVYRIYKQIRGEI